MLDRGMQNIYPQTHVVTYIIGVRIGNEPSEYQRSNAHSFDHLSSIIFCWHDQMKDISGAQNADRAGYLLGITVGMMFWENGAYS
jgi:hypothetical protein